MNVENHLVSHGYRMIGKIGFGAYASCFTVGHSRYQDVVFVCKVINLEKREKAQSSFVAEISALMNFTHPNIVQIFDYFQEEDTFYMILEYCQGGSLDKLITNGPLPNEKLFKYIKNVVAGVLYIHQQLLAHHDIKPANFLIDKFDRIKISDFGIAKKSDVFKCTLAYAAPEIFDGKPYDPFKADIWSLGVSIYQLATGRLPFPASNLTDLVKMLRAGSIEYPRSMNTKIRTIIIECLQTNPLQRTSAEKLNELTDKLFNDPQLLLPKLTKNQFTSDQAPETMRSIKRVITTKATRPILTRSKLRQITVQNCSLNRVRSHSTGPLSTNVNGVFIAPI